MSSGGTKKESDREAGVVHDVSDLSELDDFTEEMERALAEARGSSKGVVVGGQSSEVEAPRRRRWGWFLGGGS